MIRERFARERARNLQRLLCLDDLPVSMMAVCEKLGVSVTWDHRVVKGEDAVTMAWQDQYGIYLSEHIKAPGRLRFSLAHEVGHVVLGHFEEFNLRFSALHDLGRGMAWILNREANIFTEELLMPEEYIMREHWRGADYLRSACGVSPAALGIRLTNLGLPSGLMLPSRAAQA